MQRNAVEELRSSSARAARRATPHPASA